MLREKYFKYLSKATDYHLFISIGFIKFTYPFRDTERTKQTDFYGYEMDEIQTVRRGFFLRKQDWADVLPVQGRKGIYIRVEGPQEGKAVRAEQISGSQHL